MASLEMNARRATAQTARPLYLECLHMGRARSTGRGGSCYVLCIERTTETIVALFCGTLVGHKHPFLIRRSCVRNGVVANLNRSGFRGGRLAVVHLPESVLEKRTRIYSQFHPFADNMGPLTTKMPRVIDGG